MLSPAFYAMCLARWREFRREPSAFFWVVFMPIVWMVILGLAFSKPRADIHGVVLIDDQLDHVLGHSTVQGAFAERKDFKIVVANANDAKRILRRGEAVLIADVKPAGDIAFHFDPTNPNALRAKIAANNVLQEALGRQDPVALTDVPVSIAGGRYIDFLVPGLLGLSIMTSSLFGVGMSLVSNRKEQLLKRYLATPMRTGEFLASHIVGRLIVFAYEFVSILASGWILFRFEVGGNFLSFVLFALLGTAAFTAITLTCASRTASLPAMGGMINLISLPMTMLSGVFFSVSYMPDWMQRFIYCLPLTHLVEGLRLIALDHADLVTIAPHAVILAIYLIVGTIASKLLFRWY